MAEERIRAPRGPGWDRGTGQRAVRVGAPRGAGQCTMQMGVAPVSGEPPLAA